MVEPVVITAYSACNGLGRTTKDVAQKLARGEHGFSKCPLDVPFETVTGTVPGSHPPPPSKYAAHDSRVLRLALMAYEELAANVDSARKKYGDKRVGAVLATSTGGIMVTEDAYFGWKKTGRFDPNHDLEKQHQFSAFADVLCDLAGIGGPRYVVSTACSSSGKAIASAERLIRANLCDAVLVGGVDGLCHTTVRGFHSLGVLSPVPCRPFGADRPGMNVGEGAAYLLIEKAGDGPRVLGVGESSDAFHMSAPDPEGSGAKLAMERALARAGLTPADVDHVNAHGTGTARNDTAEAKAIHALLGSEVPVVSTKGYTGHTLGAGGATEAVLSVIALEQGWIPVSLGANPVDPEISINVVHEKIERKLRTVLSNSFAFGGNNVSVLFGGAA
jgi:3-oxoacyl-[acyl-carrier-protein] synthase-1